MKSLAAVKVRDSSEALRYVYAFMTNNQLSLKECSFTNPNPSKYDSEYVFPRDMYTASYSEKDLPTWESFKTNPVHLSSPMFNCLGNIDRQDRKRVLCMYMEGTVLFNCYGNYEKEATAIVDQVISASKELL